MKPKLLLIEDNDDDALLAIQSLTEAGEEFDYVHVRRLGEAMWELEGLPKKTYQKIYLDLGLSELKGGAQSVINSLANYVGRENIIAVSAHPQSGTSQKIREGGIQVLGKEHINSESNLLASLFFNQQASHEKSVARHRELARLEIQIVRLEQKLEHCEEEFRIRLSQCRDDDEDIGQGLKALREELSFLKDRMDTLELMITNTNTLALKRFEVRWQLLLALLSALAVLAAAVVPKLLEMFSGHK